MASKKKFEGPEVVVSAPRMGKFEEIMYDDNEREARKTPEQRQEELMDMAMGFSGPMRLAGKIDLRKLSKAKKWGQDLISRAVGSGGDSVARAATKDEEKKYAKGGMVKSRGDGVAQRGKTKGRMR